MEGNTNTKDTNTKDTKDTKSKDNTNTNTTDTKDTKDSKDTVTMSKTEYNEKIKDAEEKVRNELSNQIKELEEKIKELTPAEKTQAELDLEARIAALEASENEIKIQKNKLDMQEKLAAKGLDKELSDYIKDDADVDKLTSLVDNIVKSRMKSNGYVPSDHSSDDKVTIEEFNKWPYSKKAEFAEKYPESYKRLRGRK